MARAGYFWLLVPGLAVLELCAHLGFAARAPRSEEWRALAALVRAQKRAGEPVVVAPAWAEPLARQAFGDAVFPLAELARTDDAAVRRVLEISAFGARTEALRGWRVVSAVEHERFTLRVLENPTPVRVRYRFLEHVNPSELTVTLLAQGRTLPCPFTDHARVAAGGLHGELAFPRERFACPGADSTFVGVTVLDDQAYAPRQCLWAAPPPGATLRLEFAGVPLASALRGFGGLSYFLFRDSEAPPVTLSASNGDALLGRYVHQDASGWHPFRFATPGLAGQARNLTLEVRAGDAPQRDFCFALEVVE